MIQTYARLIIHSHMYNSYVTLILHRRELRRETAFRWFDFCSIGRTR